MLFEELSALTKDQATYEQFEKIEAIYNDLPEMTKQDAANLWKNTYGKALKAKNLKITNTINKILAEANRPFDDRSLIVQDMLNEAKDYFKKLLNPSEDIKKGKEFTNFFGITFKFVKTDFITPNNCWRKYDLHVIDLKKVSHTTGVSEYFGK